MMRTRRSAGYTLLELLVALTSSTLLMAGLATSVHLSLRSLDSSSTAIERVEQEIVLSNLMADVNQATQFNARAADSITFTVPDRDDDDLPETISYAWSGSPADQLSYTINSQTPTIVLDDVRNLQFSYQSQLLPGTLSDPPVLEPSLWGTRWETTETTVGFDTVFSEAFTLKGNMIGTLVAVIEPVTITSIAAYLDISVGVSPVSYAIYDVGDLGEPKNLLVNSPDGLLETSGWFTLDVAPTYLAPGAYYLFLSYSSGAVSHRHNLLGGVTHTCRTDVVRRGWPSTYSFGGIYVFSVSIYATGTAE